MEWGWIVEVQSSRAIDVHVSKLETTGKWRLIVDSSSSKGASTNDFISPPLCSLSHVSMDDVVAYVFERREGALLAKLDIQSAYRNAPVHPGDHHLLGIHWK